MRPDDEHHNTDDKSDRQEGEQESVRRPYDANDLDKLPRPSDEDPPYRGWWVV